MKKLIIGTLALFASNLLLFGQVSAGIKYTSASNFSSIKKNVEFEVVSVSYDLNYKHINAIQPTYLVKIKQNGKEDNIVAKDLPNELQLKASEDNIHNFWFAKNMGSLRTISELSNLYEIRSEIEADANDYISMLSRYNLVFEDPYLESYLYSVVSKIIPNKRADGFPYDINIVVVRDPSINAAVFPNGTMLVNTGLLAATHSEDELVAVLAHEIGHFVANHSLVNVRKMEKAQARAEFWAGMATVLAAATEIATASTGYYYSGGSLTTNTAILSYSIASSILKRIGMDYSKEQEEEADKLALDVLKYLGYDENAAATIFQRMADIYTEEGNWSAYYLAGDHPSLEERIKYCGKPNYKNDPDYEKMVSFAVTSAAITKYNQGRFTQSMKLVDQNIKNNVGTDDDYLIKALCLLNLFSDNSHNKEATTMISKAKAINSGNTNILRTEIIACLRNNDLNGASTAIEKYIARINDSLEKAKDESSYHYRMLLTELDWARKMSVKVRGL